MTGALSKLKVLDLSRILAGPTCTQLLGDLAPNSLYHNQNKMVAARAIADGVDAQLAV